MVRVRASSRLGVWVLAPLFAVSGCGYNGRGSTPTRPAPLPPPTPGQAEVSVALSETPIDAVVATEGAAWSAEWTLTIDETAGLGGNIDFVEAILTDSTGAPIGETMLDADQVSEGLGGSNHIKGGTTQELSMNLNFDFPTDVGSGDLLVTLQLTDDLGNTTSTTASEVIQICVPPQLTPVAGEVMDNGCVRVENGTLWEFDWAECSGADFYHIFVKLRTVEDPAFDRGNLTTTSFTVLSDRFIPEEARFGWFWQVRAQLNGVWSEWSPESNFDVEPLNTDCVTP